MNSRIYDSIIISSCLFGSVYIFSTSLNIINKSFYNKNLYMMDAIIYPISIISSSIYIYGIIKFYNLIK